MSTSERDGLGGAFPTCAYCGFVDHPPVKTKDECLGEDERFFLPASDPRHEHRSIGAPVRMTPTTKPNLAWRCWCRWWHFVGGDERWYPPANDETIRTRWLERLEGQR